MSFYWLAVRSCNGFGNLSSTHAYPQKEKFSGHPFGWIQVQMLSCTWTSFYEPWRDWRSREVKEIFSLVSIFTWVYWIILFVKSVAMFLYYYILLLHLELWNQIKLDPTQLNQSLIQLRSRYFISNQIELTSLKHNVFW